MKRNIRFADGDEAGGFLVFLEQAFLQQVVVHADLGDLKLALARGDGFALDVAFETETEDVEPVGIATATAGLGGVVDGLLGDGAELRSDMEVGFGFPLSGLVETLGVKVGVGEAVDAVEDGVFLFVSGLHAGALEMFENDILELPHLGVALARSGEAGSKFWSVSISGARAVRVTTCSSSAGATLRNAVPVDRPCLVAKPRGVAREARSSVGRFQILSECVR